MAKESGFKMQVSAIKYYLCAVVVAVIACDNASSHQISIDGKVDSAGIKMLRAEVEKDPDVYYFDGTQSFKVSFDSGQSYLLASSTLLDRGSVPNKGWRAMKGYCGFYFYNEKYEYVNGIRVNIADHQKTNVCNWIFGLAATSYKNQPALLATVQYHRGVDLAETISEIGSNYHDFTALLVLHPQPDGSLTIRQDDSCLGAMNQIGELAVAKKLIAQCNQ